MRKKVLVPEAEWESEMNQSRRHLPSLETSMPKAYRQLAKEVLARWPDE